MRTGIAANPTARKHLTGVWINALGGGVFDIALPLIVLMSTGSLAQMAGVAIAEQIPKAFPGLVIGALVDRKPARQMILIGYWGQAICVGLVAASSAWLGIEHLVILMVMAYIRGSLDMLARTATFVAIPEMYGKDTPAFNAALSTAWTSAAIIGPAVGGAAVTIISPEFLLIVDALSFVVMALIIGRLPLPNVRVRNEDESLLQTMRLGYGLLFRLQGWNWFMVAVGCVGILYAPLMTLALFTVHQSYGQGSTIVGFVSSAGAVGLLFGSLAAQKMAGRDPRQIMLTGSATMTIGMLLFFPEHWIATAAAVFIVCAGGIYWTVGRTTIIHDRVPDEHLGKSMTMVQFLEACIGPLSLVLATFLFNEIDPKSAFAYLFIMALISGIAVLVSPRLLQKKNDMEGIKE